jgi:molybdopterin molybdotransferase
LVTHLKTASAPASTSTPWADACRVSWETGRAALLEPVSLPLDACDGATLADDLTPLTDLPAFPTSSIDGFAVRGRAPWQIIGRVLAGQTAGELTEDGTGVEIATGAMVPAGTEAIVRVEESSSVDGRIVGEPRPEREWRMPGEEASRGDVLMPRGTPISPAVIGLAAAGGHDRLQLRPRPVAAVLVFGDELLTAGPPAAGRIRDSLGPQLPAWLRRLGCDLATPAVIGPIDDTLDAHVAAIQQAQSSGVDIILTTGGTMHGPVDHLHPALRELNASYAVNTVEVRPGFPMLLATVPRPDGGTTLLGGLPGNPQSAVVALMTLVAPALRGMTGRPPLALPTIELGAAVPGRGTYTHLALVREGEDGLGRPLEHVASSMLRGLAQSVGFAVIAPGTKGEPGDRVPLVPLPLFAGERA